MKIALVSLFALSMIACSGDSGTKTPDQPPVESPPAGEQPTAGEQPGTGEQPATGEQPGTGEQPADDGQTLPGAAEGKACVKSGCSGTVCVEEGNEVVTTCEWKPEYECYQAATCARQFDGSCGFSEPEALQQCIASKKVQ